jgi:hypothetical protein
MKPRWSVSASLGAIMSSLASLSCCLRLGFAAALGAGAASAFLARLWLLTFQAPNPMASCESKG